MSNGQPIKQGDSVRIKSEWQDLGDDKYLWVATEDESGGRVHIAPTNTGLQYPPCHAVHTYMLE
jgi:hypothetical protein